MRNLLIALLAATLACACADLAGDDGAGLATHQAALDDEPIEPEPPPDPTHQDLVMNGHFEAGVVNGPARYWGCTAGALVTRALAHTGFNSLWLYRGWAVGNVATASHWVSIPDTAGSATLSFVAYVGSSRVGVNDYLQVKIEPWQDGVRQPTETLVWLSRSSPAGWAKHSFDVARHRGRRIRVIFDARWDPAPQGRTDFLFDDVKLLVPLS